MAIQRFKSADVIGIKSLHELCGSIDDKVRGDKIAAYLGEAGKVEYLKKEGLYALDQNSRVKLDMMLTAAVSIKLMNPNRTLLNQAILVFVDEWKLGEAVSILDSIVDDRPRKKVYLDASVKRMMYFMDPDDGVDIILAGAPDWYDSYRAFEKFREEICDTGIMFDNKRKFFDVMAVCVTSSVFCKKLPDGKSVRVLENLAERCKAPLLISNFQEYQNGDTARAEMTVLEKKEPETVDVDIRLNDAEFAKVKAEYDSICARDLYPLHPNGITHTPVQPSSEKSAGSTVITIDMNKKGKDPMIAMNDRISVDNALNSIQVKTRPHLTGRSSGEEEKSCTLFPGDMYDNLRHDMPGLVGVVQMAIDIKMDNNETFKEYKDGNKTPTILVLLRTGTEEDAFANMFSAVTGELLGVCKTPEQIFSKLESNEFSFGKPHDINIIWQSDLSSQNYMSRDRIAKYIKELKGDKKVDLIAVGLDNNLNKEVTIKALATEFNVPIFRSPCPSKYLNTFNAE